jgi:integrase/recombinase XerD
VIHRDYMEDVTREDVLKYVKWERETEKNSPRTANNRACFLRAFFRHFGLTFPLANKDLPRYTAKRVKAYSPAQVDSMFAHANKHEADLLHFLLCTGAREQEAQYACWTDVDLTQKRYTFTEHIDLGFRPKDREEGTIPFPEILVQVLKARRKRHPRTRLIFPGPNGVPNGHMLRMIKAVALRAGINCGHCVNKAGQSCAKHPVSKQGDPP